MYEFCIKHLKNLNVLHISAYDTYVKNFWKNSSILFSTFLNAIYMFMHKMQYVWHLAIQWIKRRLLPRIKRYSKWTITCHTFIKVPNTNHSSHRVLKQKLKCKGCKDNFLSLQADEWLPGANNSKAVTPFTIQLQDEQTTEIKCRKVQITKDSVSILFIINLILFIYNNMQYVNIYLKKCKSAQIINVKKNYRSAIRDV